MLLTQIESLPQTQRSLRTRLVMTSLSLLCLLELLTQVAAGAAQPSLEIFPKYFVLHPGEQIHYNVCPSEAVAQYLRGTLPRGEFHCIDAKFSTEDPKVLHLISPTTIKNGEKTTVDGVLEAVRPGRTKLVVRTTNSEQRFTITVAGAAQPPIIAVPHNTVKEIKASEFLFVGHAGLDGFDFTAVAKPGIDRVVAEAKKNGVPVVYWVSNEYPNWYTADRHVPFLNRVITEFPFVGYPRNAPAPPLSDLLKGWTIVVRFGDGFERLYQQGDSNKSILLEFHGV